MALYADSSAADPLAENDDTDTSYFSQIDFPVTAGDVFLLQGRQRHYFHDRQDLDLVNIMYDPEKIGLPENELRRMPGYCAMFILEPTYRRQHRFASRLLPLKDKGQDVVNRG